MTTEITHRFPVKDVFARNAISQPVSLMFSLIMGQYTKHQLKPDLSDGVLSLPE